MDLEMLAPYISMDDDFQLTVLSSLPEEADKPLPSWPEPSSVSHAITASRKRYDGPAYFGVAQCANIRKVLPYCVLLKMAP